MIHDVEIYLPHSLNTRERRLKIESRRWFLDERGQPFTVAVGIRMYDHWLPVGTVFECACGTWVVEANDNPRWNVHRARPVQPWHQRARRLRARIRRLAAGWFQ